MSEIKTFIPASSNYRRYGIPLIPFVFLLLFLGSTLSVCQVQTKIDSLEYKLNRDELNQEERVELLLALTKEYGFIAPEKGIEYGNRALEISRETGNKINEALALRYLGVSYHFLDKYAIAMAYYDSSLVISVNEKYIDGQGACLFNIGSIYEYLGDFNKALEYYLKAIRIKENSDDKRGLAYILVGLGNIYKYQNNYELALEYFQKSLDINQKLGIKNEIAYSLYNIGIIYQDMKDIDKALSYMQESLEIRRAINDMNGMATSLLAIGNIYLQRNDYQNALQYFLEALELAGEIDNKWSTISALLQIGTIYSKTDQFDRAFDYLSRGLELAKEINSKTLIKDSYKDLSDYYLARQDYKSSMEYYTMYSEMKDSIYNEEISEQITRMQTIYETDQKDKEIQLQRSEIKRNEAELTKHNIQRNALITGIVLVMLLMAILYRSYRHKKRTNTLLTEQNIKINQQKEEIKTQRDYLEALNQELSKQKIELQNALADLKQTQSQLVESERMASLGQLTAGLAHELNNPINFISGNVKPLQRDVGEILHLLDMYESCVREHELSDSFIKVESLKKEIDLSYLVEEINKLLEGIGEGALRSGQIVKGLRSFSRLDIEKFEITNIHGGLDSVINLLEARMKDRITVHRKYGDIPQIECLPAKLNQVFLNILTNSIQAMEGTGEILIETGIAGNSIQVSIKDNGKGMNAEVMNNIFEPFFTTHDVGEGTGLGLAISYGIIKQHGGRIDVKSSPGKGAEFIVILPLERDP